MGSRTHIEKAYGNVRNPGPNAPLGWQSEEPSVWTDDLKGIERSSQNILVIECEKLDEVKKVSEYLHSVGNKNKENATQSDPAWYVPDIRIFGLKEEDTVENFKPALLHIKEGRL